METVLVAIGNTLRGDDGVAHRVLEYIGEMSGVRSLAVHQLTPEIAQEIAGAVRVFFIDADTRPGEPAMEAIDGEVTEHSPIGHTMTAREVAALSRSLFGFLGSAWLVRVPGYDFSATEALSPRAEKNARAAVAILTRRISEGA